ncbi:MAG: TIGR02996 domain-containing protein, partial [Myxococcales bacterium]|nr:TIGR02996 domain-containing protein [Myxococcales bacterium]
MRPDALIERVLAAPDDDEARLVYADACEEAGDIERATFIRLQLDQARLSRWDSRHFELAHAVRMLEARNRRRWLAELPHFDGVAYGRFRRGFVDTVYTRRARDLDLALPRLRDSVPLRRWVCRLADEDGLSLRDPAHDIREVELESWSRRDGQEVYLMARALGLPVCADLDRLALPWSRPAYDVDIGEVLRRWGCRVRELSLGCDALEPVAMEAFLEAPGLQRLERLELGSQSHPPRNTSIDPEHVLALVLKCRSLVALDIDTGHLAPESAQVVFDHGPPGLEELAVSGTTGIDPRRASFTLRSLRAQRLVLDLTAPCFTRLHTLAGWGPDGEFVLPQSLQALRISGGTATCADPPTELESLELSRAPGLVGMVHGCHRTLRTLRLLECGNLAVLPTMPRLRVLRVHEGAVDADLLERHPGVRSLSLSYQEVSDRMLRATASMDLVDIDLPA